MAGHNKWSKVKHIKARVDARKGKVFSRFSQEISIAARDGGGDPDLNPRLRTAIDGAKSQSMPKENIERAIKKGTGARGLRSVLEQGLMDLMYDTPSQQDVGEVLVTAEMVEKGVESYDDEDDYIRKSA